MLVTEFFSSLCWKGGGQKMAKYLKMFQFSESVFFRCAFFCEVYLAYASSKFCKFISSQAAISWCASDDRQISLSASAERAFENFCDKKHCILKLQNFATKCRNCKFLRHFFNTFFTIA